VLLLFAETTLDAARADDGGGHAQALFGALGLEAEVDDLRGRIATVQGAWDEKDDRTWAAPLSEPPLEDEAAAAVGDGTPGDLRRALTVAEQAVVFAVCNHGDDDTNLVCLLAAGAGGSNVRILGKHFGRLRNAWLFDESVNAYMLLLQERDKRRCAATGARPSHFMSSFFFEKVKCAFCTELMSGRA
jgi:hypothetical protein